MAPKLKSLVRLLLLAVAWELSAHGATDRDVKPEVRIRPPGFRCSSDVAEPAWNKGQEGVTDKERTWRSLEKCQSWRFSLTSWCNEEG